MLEKKNGNNARQTVLCIHFKNNNVSQTLFFVKITSVSCRIYDFKH
jgi:hypothetical protein